MKGCRKNVSKRLKTSEKYEEGHRKLKEDDKEIYESKEKTESI